MDTIINKIINKTNNKQHRKKRKNKNKNKDKNKDKNKNDTNLNEIKDENPDNIVHKDHKEHKDHKDTIPKRLRELVWTTNNSETFTNKCYVSWCDNKINVFNFQVGHNIPESKGGTLDINNLKPICSNCNLSMGNRYTIDEWCKLVKI